MTVKIQGIKEVQRNLAKLSEKFSQAVVDAAVAGAHAIRADAIESIQNQSPGREVTRSRVGGGEYSHTAAAEGQAPNTDTGALVNSVQVEVLPDGVLVGSRLKYAGWLELGTKTMGARPWLIPATEKNRRNIEKETGKKINLVILKDGNV